MKANGMTGHTSHSRYAGAVKTAPWLFAICLLSPAELLAADADRDGLDDALEQALLERFAPTLYLSQRECDSRPAEFRPSTGDPRVLARNGTLYGRVSPHGSTARPGTWVEVQYFHLWGRDCGRAGHDLDAEHVSALLRAEGDPAIPDAWRAEFWYAGAHEGTLCDKSHVGRAAGLRAERNGPVVWVSRGKHASYLSPRLCGWGCGGDDCSDGVPFRSARLVNLGEPGALPEGAGWALSAQWGLASKFKTDFPDERIALLAKPKDDALVLLNPELRPAQAVLLAGDSTADALELSRGKTGAALNTAGRHTDNALKKAVRSTGRFLGVKEKK